LTARSSDPPIIKSLRFRGHEFLTKVDDEDFPMPNQLWRLSHIKFTVTQLKEMLAEVWGIPLDQFEIKISDKMDPDTEYRLPKSSTLQWPEQGIPPDKHGKTEE
jgi:hypothetical protein